MQVLMNSIPSIWLLVNVIRNNKSCINEIVSVYGPKTIDSLRNFWLRFKCEFGVSLYNFEDLWFEKITRKM